MMHTPRETQAQRIARVLSGRIIDGKIPPGARLRQDHIAAEFGVSHVPVREAFRLLEIQRLAETLPRRGCRVTEFDLAELQEVAQMRASLESLALRHAAPNITRQVIAEAEDSARQCDSASCVEDWEVANRQFHRLILAPCAMPRLLQTIEELQTASARFLFAAWRRSWEARTDLDHQAILAALRAGQTERACAILSQHVGRIGTKRRIGKERSQNYL